MVPANSLKYGHWTPTLQLQHPVQLDLPIVFARLKIVESVLLGVTGWERGLPTVSQPVKSFCFVLRAGIAAESKYLWDDWWLSRCITAKIIPSCFFLHPGDFIYADLLLHSPVWFRFCRLRALILYDWEKKKNPGGNPNREVIWPVAMDFFRVFYKKIS